MIMGTRRRRWVAHLEKMEQERKNAKTAAMWRPESKKNVVDDHIADGGTLPYRILKR